MTYLLQFATKADVNLLKIAVDGLSTEVRAISNHLKQLGGEGGSSGHPTTGPSRTSRKQVAAEDDGDDYAADSEEVEKLTLPARARSSAHNQLAVWPTSLIRCRWTLIPFSG